MLTAAEITSMRETSASALPATCRITRPAGGQVFDPATGQYSTPTPTTVYEGPCRIRTLNNQDMAVIVGDLHETLGRYVCTLLHTATGIQVDDFLTVIAGYEDAYDDDYISSTDTELVGRPLRITDIRWSEWHIDRRLVLEDQQQP